MRSTFKKVPVKYKDKIYAGFVTPNDDKISVELKLGTRRRRCKLANDSVCLKLFDEMIIEIDAAGELGVLSPDAYLTELEAVARESNTG